MFGKMIPPGIRDLFAKCIRQLFCFGCLEIECGSRGTKVFERCQSAFLSDVHGEKELRTNAPWRDGRNHIIERGKRDSLLFVKKTMVARMIVRVSDEDVERDPPKQFVKILRRMD